MTREAVQGLDVPAASGKAITTAIRCCGSTRSEAVTVTGIYL